MFHWFKKHNKEGLETPDPTPVELPLTEIRPPTLAEQIARFVRAPDLVAAVQKRGIDTFDEADDFEMDDGMPVSPYEFKDMHEDLPVQTRMDEMRAGVVEEMPFDRSDKAKERLRPKPKEAEAKKEEPKGS